MMTYGNRMPTSDAATAGVATGRHRTNDRLPSSDGSGCGPLVTADAVQFRVRDAEHELDGVRLEVDWILGDVDPEFAWSDGYWSLLLPRPDAWRLEYQLTFRRGREHTWTTDPGNPRTVPNPFGEKSEIRFPEYHEPGWLVTEPAGPLRRVDTPAGRLD